MTRPAHVTLRAALFASGLFAAIPLHAQRTDSVALRPLATRAELEAVAARGTEAHKLRAEAERRLLEGDFDPGGLLLLEVQGEVALTDTFVVDASRSIHLPSPVVGALSLRGVLRSEADEVIRGFVGRFINRAVVRARPLLRVSLEGEVERAGYYAIPADAPISEALMAGHGVTRAADLGKVRIERDGRTLLGGSALRDAMARGWTLDDARLRDGDALLVGRGRGDIEGKLRFLWVVVSLAGGIYGLTRAL